MCSNREALIQSIKALMGEEKAKMANIEALYEDELEELLQDLRSGGVVSEYIEDVLTDNELAEILDYEEYDEPGTMSEEEWEAILKDIDNMPDDELAEILDYEEYDEPGTMSEEEWEALLKDIDDMPDDEEEEIIIDEEYPFDDEEQ